MFAVGIKPMTPTIPIITPPTQLSSDLFFPIAFFTLAARHAFFLEKSEVTHIDEEPI